MVTNESPGLCALLIEKIQLGRGVTATEDGNIVFFPLLLLVFNILCSVSEVKPKTWIALVHGYTLKLRLLAHYMVEYFTDCEGNLLHQKAWRALAAKGRTFMDSEPLCSIH